MILILILLVFVGYSWFLSHFELMRRFAFIVMPATLLLMPIVRTGKLQSDFKIFTMMGALILFGIYNAGSHKHTKSDGSADKRHKNNPYTNFFSEDFREFSLSGLIGLSVVSVILFFVK